MSDTKTGQLKVLIVDDSDFSRLILSQMTTELGYQLVGEANNAETALRLVKEKNPDVVITDIVMPEISGIELTAKIMENFDNITVIVISSLSQEHIVLDAIGAGASDFISKPIDKKQLQDSLEKVKSQLGRD